MIRKSGLHNTGQWTNRRSIAGWRMHRLAPTSAIPSLVALSGSLVMRHLGKSARFRAPMRAIRCITQRPSLPPHPYPHRRRLS